MKTGRQKRLKGRCPSLTSFWVHWGRICEQILDVSTQLAATHIRNVPFSFNSTASQISIGSFCAPLVPSPQFPPALVRQSTGRSHPVSTAHFHVRQLFPHPCCSHCFHLFQEVTNKTESSQFQVRAIQSRSGNEEFLTKTNEARMRLDECNKKFSALREQKSGILAGSGIRNSWRGTKKKREEVMKGFDPSLSLSLSERPLDPSQRPDWCSDGGERGL